MLIEEDDKSKIESDSFSDSDFELVKDLKEEKKSINIKLSTALQPDNSQEKVQTNTTSVPEVDSEHVNNKTVMSADSTVTCLNLKETVLSSDDDGRRVIEEVEDEDEEEEEGSEKKKKRSKKERPSRSDRKKKKRHRKRDRHSRRRGSSKSPYRSQSHSHSYSRSRSRSRSR